MNLSLTLQALAKKVKLFNHQFLKREKYDARYTGIILKNFKIS